jgi:hypothetical protein
MVEATNLRGQSDDLCTKLAQFIQTNMSNNAHIVTVIIMATTGTTVSKASVSTSINLILLAGHVLQSRSKEGIPNIRSPLLECTFLCGRIG